MKLSVGLKTETELAYLMKKILYIMIGMPSCYNSGFALATRLQNSGLEVEIACNKNIIELMSGTGIPFHYLKEDRVFQDGLSIEIGDQSFTRYSVRHPIKFLRLCRKYRKLSLQAFELNNLIQTTLPDALLIDIECHYAIVATKKYKLPGYLVSRWFTTQKSISTPPLHSPRSSSNTFIGIFRTQWEWVKLAAFRYRKEFKDHFSKYRLLPVGYRTISRANLKQLARAQGVELKDFTERSQWLLPHGYSHYPVMSLNAKEMELDNVNTSNTQYFGPMVSQWNSSFVTPEVVRTELERYLDTIRTVSYTHLTLPTILLV